jgi:hypothetical protein
MKPTFHFQILLKLHMCIAKEQFGKLDHLCKCDQILDSFWRNVLVTRCTSQDNDFQINCELSFLWTFLRWEESVFVTNIMYFNYLSHKNHILVLTKVLLGYSKPNFIDIYVLNQSNYHWIRWKCCDVFNCFDCWHNELEIHITSWMCSEEKKNI